MKFFKELFEEIDSSNFFNIEAKLMPFSYKK